MALVYFTIEDKIVKSSLVALSKSSRKSNSLVSPILTGGIALQIYCKDFNEFLRPTSDIDLIYVPRIMDFDEFSEGIGQKIQKNILKQGFQVQLKKIRNRFNYQVKVMDGQGKKAKGLFFIHFDQLSPELYKKTGFITLEEAKNSNSIQYEGHPLHIKKIEDMIPHKLKRLKKSIHYTGFDSPLEESLFHNAENLEWGELAKIPLDNWLNNIIVMQNELTASVEPRSHKYTINKDLYDLCLLSRYIEGNSGSFNKAYFLKSKKIIDSI